jgi:hypothetical protein
VGAMVYTVLRVSQPVQVEPSGKDSGSISMSPHRKGHLMNSATRVRVGTSTTISTVCTAGRKTRTVVYPLLYYTVYTETWENLATILQMGQYHWNWPKQYNCDFYPVFSFPPLRLGNSGKPESSGFDMVINMYYTFGVQYPLE